MGITVYSLSSLSPTLLQGQAVEAVTFGLPVEPRGAGLGFRVCRVCRVCRACRV